MSWLDFDGYRVWYQREGSGQPILFLHHGEAEEHVVDRAGHMLPLERPTELNSIVEAFLQHHAAQVLTDAGRS